MAQKYVYNGTTKLGNVAMYVAEELRVPVAAISLKFRWMHPETGKWHTMEGSDLLRPLTDLRRLWDT